jgi:hypothetical protein
LYPAIAQEDSGSQDSLAEVLLEQLGLAATQPSKPVTDRETEIRRRHPVE